MDAISQKSRSVSIFAKNGLDKYVLEFDSASFAF